MYIEEIKCQKITHRKESVENTTNHSTFNDFDMVFTKTAKKYQRIIVSN